MTRLIDADELIASYKEIDFSQYNSEYVDIANAIIRDIEQASTMYEWIPCSERLPETPEKYFQKKNYLCCFEYGYITSVGWWNGWNCSMAKDGTTDRACEMTDIVAWMELPKPYKVGDIK